MKLRDKNFSKNILKNKQNKLLKHSTIINICDVNNVKNFVIKAIKDNNEFEFNFPKNTKIKYYKKNI
jgi:hypothetical protein